MSLCSTDYRSQILENSVNGGQHHHGGDRVGKDLLGCDSIH